MQKPFGPLLPPFGPEKHFAPARQVSVNVGKSKGARRRGESPAGKRKKGAARLKTLQLVKLCIIFWHCFEYMLCGNDIVNPKNFKL
jgi:hypothetical protein